jgi:hypothetical protein
MFLFLAFRKDLDGVQEEAEGQRRELGEEDEDEHPRQGQPLPPAHTTASDGCKTARHLYMDEKPGSGYWVFHHHQ